MCVCFQDFLELGYVYIYVCVSIYLCAVNTHKQGADQERRSPRQHTFASNRCQGKSYKS